MKKHLFILLVVLLSACQNETPIDSDPTALYSEEDIEAAREEAREEAKQEGYEEGYDEGYIAGNDEGYKLGYGTAMEELESQYANSVNLPPPTSSAPASISTGLNLFSDKLDWDIATDYEKKEFIRSAFEADGKFITFSDLDDYSRAVDIYYESNSLNTLKDALESLR